MRIIVVGIVCYFFSILAYAQEEIGVIQKAINQFAQSSGLENAAISFQVVDLEKDSVLGEYNAKMALPPASTTKLFTTAAALEILGKDFQPTTKIFYSGVIDTAGTLHGDVILKGFGDASLGSRFFYERNEKDSFLYEWTTWIKEKNIKTIQGRIIADGSAFGYQGVPDGWTWSDMGNYYGAGASAIAVYDNMTYLHFSSSNSLNSLTKIDSTTPPISGLNIRNEVTTYAKNSDNAYIYGTPFSYERFAIGNIPKGRVNFEVKASIPDPELLLAQVFENALKKAGISIEKVAKGYRILTSKEQEEYQKQNLQLIGEYKGKSIEELVHWTNKRSVNFFAEQLLQLASYKGNPVSIAESVKFINQYWEGKLGIKMHQTDGSGLSRSNAFSAEHFIHLLTYMKHSKSFVNFENSLPVAGESGTLTSIGRGQISQGRVKAKSGTLNRVRAYAGYVNSRSGKTLAFAIIVNNHDLSNAQLTKKLEQLFNVMAGS